MQLQPSPQSSFKTLSWGGRSYADKNYCRTIILNRSSELAGAVERSHPLEKCELTSVRCPSAERLGTTVLHFLSAQGEAPAVPLGKRLQSVF